MRCFVRFCFAFWLIMLRADAEAAPKAEAPLLVPGPGPGLASPPKRPLTIEEALSLATKNNRDLQAAAERLRGAYSDVERALAALLPTVAAQGRLSLNYPSVTVTFDPNAMVTATIVARTQLDGFLTATIPLIAPPAYPALKGARLAYEAQQRQLDVTKAQVLTTVATAFYAAAGNDELVGARHHAIELANKTVDNATSRLTAGVLSKVDVTRARLALLQAEQRLLEAQDSRAAAYRLLATLLRIEAMFKVQPPAELGSDASSAEHLVDLALRQRPELLGLQLQARAQGMQVRSSWLRWAPSLSVFGGLRLTNATGFSGQYYGYSVGLQLDWLVFDGLLRNADRHAFEAAQRSTLLQLEQLRDTISDEVKNGRDTVLTRQQGLVTAVRSVTLAQETLELVRKQYQAGTATQLDLLSAQDALIQAEVSVAQARFDLALAVLRLRQLSGEALTRTP